MTVISIEEHDLLEFFGSEHVSRKFGTQWFDSDSVYKHQESNGVTVTLAIHPIHKDARITLSFQGQTYYDWQATALADITYVRYQTCLQFSSQAGDTLTLRIVPHIAISHNSPFRSE